MTAVLYTYFRSSAAFRVRIALSFKGIPYEPRFVHLLKGGGEQHQPAYKSLNPAGLVPTLLQDGQVITQSVAILEYIEETHPFPPLLPKSALGRAHVRALVADVAADIHPINNLRVLQTLERQFGAEKLQKETWVRHWIEVGFSAIESKLASTSGIYCFEDQVSLADIVLVPQVYNARRFGVDLSPFPLIQSIEQRCMQLDAFTEAAPNEQPDAE
jgi:maleylacetoacetate isomerase